MAIGESRQQRDQRTDGEEDDPGDHSHVVSGNGEHVSETGNVHGLVELRRQSVALSCNQRRGDCAALAGQYGADAPIDGLAHTIHEHGVAQPKRGRVRWLSGANATERKS